jgi:hypothetical protein
MTVFGLVSIKDHIGYFSHGRPGNLKCCDNVVSSVESLLVSIHHSVHSYNRLVHCTIYTPIRRKLFLDAETSLES